MRGLTLGSAMSEPASRPDVPLLTPSTGRWGLLELVRRLLHHRSALVGLLVVVAYIAVALTAPWLAPRDPTAQNPAQSLRPPSLEHPMGTDRFGRDQLSRAIYGTRISLVVAALSVLISATGGSLVGLVSGYLRGTTDTIFMRVIDIMLAFPGLLLALVLVTMLGNGLPAVVVAVGLAGIPNFARVVRGMVLSAVQNDYVQAARATGATDRRVMFVHVLPNVVAPAVVLTTLYVAFAVLTASSLSFLGVGVQPPTPEWGAMVNAGRSLLYVAWWISTFPALMIMGLVLAVNLLGDGLRDILDPHLQV
jgi:ABC-type dipeptide/oligopeptide/nickel transport system permease subunit